VSFHADIQAHAGIHFDFAEVLDGFRVRLPVKPAVAPV
jgi:hypothetical protein